MSENFKNITQGLNDAVKYLGIPSSGALTEVFNKWPDIVGEKIAKFCQPSEFKDGILLLKCRDYTWYSQFKYYKKPIENSLQNRLQLSKPIEVQIVMTKE